MPCNRYAGRSPYIPFHEYIDTTMDHVTTWAGILLCLTQSAMFSGLNLACFSVSRVQHEIEAAQKNQDAIKVLALRKDANFLLTTILWGCEAASTTWRDGNRRRVRGTASRSGWARGVGKKYYWPHGVDTVVNGCLKSYSTRACPTQAMDHWAKGLGRPWTGSKINRPLRDRSAVAGTVPGMAFHHNLETKRPYRRPAHRALCGSKGGKRS